MSYYIVDISVPCFKVLILAIKCLVQFQPRRKHSVSVLEPALGEHRLCVSIFCLKHFLATPTNSVI